MNKKTIMFLSLMLLAASLWSLPSTYYIKKLPAGTTVTLDGDMSKWPQEYFIDSLHSDLNVYMRDDSIWTRADFQMHVWAAWDENAVYFAAKVISDDVYGLCGGSEFSCGCDNLHINANGQASAFYVYSNGILFRRASDPWQVDSDLRTSVNSHGGENNLPSYEVSISRLVLDQFDRRSFQMFFGTWDADGGQGSCSNDCFMSIGMEYTGNKTQWNSQWDNPLYYPTWYLSDTSGPELNPTISEQGQVAACQPTALQALPNPFNPVTTIHFANHGHDASVTIMDVNGRVVSRFEHVRESQVKWNAGKEPNGVYFVKVSADRQNWTSRIFLMK